MVKIQDGTLANASELLAGVGEDDDGRPLNFVPVGRRDSQSYRAESLMTDESGRKKVYTFDIPDPEVRVHVLTVEPEEVIP